MLFFGDSLTAGYGLTNATQESFPALIQQKIQQEGFNYTIINGGLSGDTSVGGLKRIDYWTSQPIHVFILELGVNDIIRGIRPEVTQQNLQEIIDKVKRKFPAVKMALMGMEIPLVIPGPFGDQFKKIFRLLADKNEMAFVPFFLEGVAGQRHLNLKDGIHPYAAGYKINADNVWPVIRMLLK